MEVLAAGNHRINLLLQQPQDVLTSITKKAHAPEEEDDCTLVQSEEDFDVLCHKLEENDTTVTAITLGDESINDFKAVKLSSSLDGNTTVRKITVDLRFLDQFCGSVYCLLEYLETSSALSAVELKYADLEDSKVCTVLLVLLPAISKNPNVQDFKMTSRDVVFLDCFAAFMHTLLQAFKTIFRHYDGKTVRMLQSALAVSFCQCKTLEHLELQNMPEAFLCQLLPDLSKLDHLESLLLQPKQYQYSYSVDTFVALSALLTTTTSLRHLTMQGYSFTQYRFEPIAVGMENNTTIRAWTIDDCWFNHGATELFQSMFSNKDSHPLTQLTLGPSVNFYYSVGTVISNILKQDMCTLTQVDLKNCPLWSNDMVYMLQSLGSHADEHNDDDGDTKVDEDIAPTAGQPKQRRRRLEILHLDFVNDPTEIEALKENIPKLFGLKQITIHELGPTFLDQQEDLIDAFRCNATLERCSIGTQETILQGTTGELDQAQQMQPKKSLPGGSDDESKKESVGDLSRTMK